MKILKRILPDTAKSKQMAQEPNRFIFVLYFLLSAVGLFILLDISASRSSMVFFYMQLAWFSVALISVAVFARLNIEQYRFLIPLCLAIVIGLLVLVLLKGSDVKGARRSINLVFFNLQPSVLAQVFLVLYYAHVLDNKKKLLPYTKPSYFLINFLPLIAITLLVFGLILKEKHLSPLIIMSGTIFSLLWLAGIRKMTLVAILAIALIGGIFVISNGAKYRSERIEIYKKYSLFFKYLGITSDCKSQKEFQVKESLTALSSGGLLGTMPSGGRGKQYYLPEARTDYVFTIIGEEFGFLGAITVFFLFCLFFYITMNSSWQQPTMFLRLAGCGLSLNLFLNVLVNIGVAMSALPSTGVTLPFISYGGSALVLNSIAVGMLVDISRLRRQQR